ncbi:hypothetical protein [Poriferisphaera sp. WC338]|uniref:hypothetical protein n=1 Tax=Poriferisphaera sp. WC338 TaxID=3425129 RepID=UPI003D8138D3
MFLRSTIMSSACMLSLCFSMANTLQAGYLDTITIDGDLSDWDPAAVFYVDADISDSTITAAGYQSISVANDATHLYIGIATEGAGGGSIANAWRHVMYVDADLDGDTGFDSGWMTNGYDYLVEYGASSAAGGIFSFNSAVQTDWAWAWVNPLTYSFSDSAIEWAIPLVDLGSVSDVVLTFNVNSTGGTETWAYKFESGSLTYTLAPVPEPASLALLIPAVLLISARRKA